MARPAVTLGQIVTFLHELDRLGPPTREALEADLVRTRFVLHTLTILGEAVRRLPAPFLDAHPEVDWRGVISMRNRVVHGYDRVDFDAVWRVLRDEVGPLRARVERLRAALPPTDQEE